MEARQEWLAARKKGMGGSDAAVACDMSPWKTQHELYLEKRNEISDAFGDDPPEHIRFGNVLEDVIAGEYAYRTGRKVRRVKAMKQHPKHPFMLANIDRKIEGEDRLLECKNVGDFSYKLGEWGEEGTDQIPEYYLMQVQHYLAVTGFDVADLAALVGGNSLKIYTIERDEDLINNMIELEGKFWEHVMSGTPPPVDFNHRSTVDMIKRKYTGTNGVIITLPEHAYALHLEAVNIREEVKKLETQGTAISARLRDMIGENAAGRFDNGEGGYRRKEMEEKEVAAFTRKGYFDFRWVKNI